MKQQERDMFVLFDFNQISVMTHQRFNDSNTRLSDNHVFSLKSHKTVREDNNCIYQV